jgi:hypothetical protein
MVWECKKKELAVVGAMQEKGTDRDGSSAQCAGSACSYVKYRCLQRCFGS